MTTTKATHQINIDDTSFKFSHGREPKGTGNGCVRVSSGGRSILPSASGSSQEFFLKGTVTQVRQQAAREFIAGVTFEPGTHNIVTVAIHP